MNGAGLWRDRPFVLYWLARTVSVAGSALTYVVLPILVYQLTGSALQTSLLIALEVSPYLAFGLVAGALADRVIKSQWVFVEAARAPEAAQLADALGCPAPFYGGFSFMTFQAYLDTIKSKTGQTPATLYKLAVKQKVYHPEMKAAELVAWLKKDFALGQGHAMAVWAVWKDKGWVHAPSKKKPS